MLKQNLSQKMIQKLSPQQIQLMKLLQVPTSSLEQRIKEELETNPALDEGPEEEASTIDEDKEVDQPEESSPEETFELDDYLEEYIDDDPVIYNKYSSQNSDDLTDQKEIPLAVEDSFHDYLETQLGMRDGLTDRQIIIAHQIIGSIDHDGYLRREPLSISDDLLFTLNIDVNEGEVIEMLKLIQKFDPPGSGARNLNECLNIQLVIEREKMEDSGIPIPISMQRAEVILNKYFNEFSKKHYSKLIKSLDINDQELKEALSEILKLNPKPASGYQGGRSSRSQYVLPDFIIENRDGELNLRLNSKNAPDLRVNDQYRELLVGYKEKKRGRNETKQDSEAVMFIKQKIDAAKWFIEAIKQRQDTMYKTMYAMMQYQYDFFLSGDQRRLRPMILKDIAELTNLDISTVSRVANSKYVQTEFGTRRLKEFFSESVTTQAGEEVSTLEVKNILAEIISEEEKRKPLSDEKLKIMLSVKGYNIARRTVAKYREQLNIPVARLRREL